MTFGYRLGLGKAGCQGNHLKKMHPKPSRLAPAIFKNKFPAKGLEIRRANGDSRRQAGNLKNERLRGPVGDQVSVLQGPGKLPFCR